MTLAPSSLPFAELSSTQQQRTWLAAQQYGGGFIAALAAAWFNADPTNRARLSAAFPEVATKYGPASPFYPHEAEL